jgi:hypothetical protein
MTDDHNGMRPSEPSPHLTRGDIARFASGALAGSELIVFTDHLATCAECRARVAGPADVAAARTRFEAAIGLADGHVDEDDVHAYVDGRLDVARRSEIDAHLAQCASCADEIRDLQSFAGQAGGTRAGRVSWWFAGLAAAAALILGVFAFQSTRPSPSMQLVLNDEGARIGLDTLGNMTGVNGLSADGRSRVTQALATGRLTLAPSVLSLAANGSALRGPAEAGPFRVIAPVATAVLSDLPSFRWTALSEHASYVVRVRDEGTGSTVVSPALRGETWTPEAPLPRGDTYVWQVEASADGREIIAPAPPAAIARFTIVTAADAARLAQAPASHLVRGVLYADAGLLDDAAQELGQLRAQNPDSDLVQRFLDQLSRERFTPLPSDDPQQQPLPRRR